VNKTYRQGQILRLIVASDELIRDVEDLATMLTDDRLPRRLITAEATLDERVNFLRGRWRVSRHEG